MVPLRTGRVFYAVAWAVSEGPDRLVLLWESSLMIGRSQSLQRKELCGAYRGCASLEKEHFKHHSGNIVDVLFLCITLTQLNARF